MSLTNEIDATLPVTKGDWRPIQDGGKFVCRNCGTPAVTHPQTNRIWGCKACGYTTASVATYFEPVFGGAPCP